MSWTHSVGSNTVIELSKPPIKEPILKHRWYFIAYLFVCVCVCVCLRERERVVINTTGMTPYGRPSVCLYMEHLFSRLVVLIDKGRGEQMCYLLCSWSLSSLEHLLTQMLISLGIFLPRARAIVMFKRLMWSGRFFLSAFGKLLVVVLAGHSLSLSLTQMWTILCILFVVSFHCVRIASDVCVIRSTKLTTSSRLVLHVYMCIGEGNPHRSILLHDLYIIFIH